MTDAIASLERLRGTMYFFSAVEKGDSADEAHETAMALDAAILALRALRDAPVGCVQAFAPYSVDVAFTDRYAHGLDLRQRVALVPLDTTAGKESGDAAT